MLTIYIKFLVGRCAIEIYHYDKSSDKLKTPSFITSNVYLMFTTIATENKVELIFHDCYQAIYYLPIT